MQVGALPGGDPQVESALAAAGLPTAEQLSRVGDLTALARATGVPEERLRALQEEARSEIERRLREGGVADERALAEADLAAIAARTGIGVAELARFRAAAREALGLPAEDARVVLREGAPTALVRWGATPIEGVTILTAAPRPDAVEEALTRYAGDVVVLQSGAETAVARLAGATQRAVPLYAAAPEGAEVRVRVAEVRERGSAVAAEPGAEGGRRPFWRRAPRK
jgi:hypothetical protein